jgi:drug/metabolite transporter (DMT)-like permease
MSSIKYILLSGALGVAGQFILKLAMASLGPLSLQLDTLPSLVLSIVLNPLVIGGLAIYVTGTFFWLVALSRTDLSYAYPFASLNYILVLVVSWLGLGEQLSLVRIVGVIAICLGVWAISRSPARSTRRQSKQSVAAPAVAAEGAHTP